MIAKGGQPEAGGRPFDSSRIDGLIIEGAAIVSADGMIADASGVQPDALKLDADQRFFHRFVRAADVLVHGRNSGEGGPQADERRRIVVTRQIADVARDPAHANTVLWNPAGAPLAQAWALLGATGGRLAVIGGTEVFGLFLEYGYDLFHLSRAGRAHLPGGRPVFPAVSGSSPEDLLASHGLKPDAMQVLDASADLTLTTWRR
jgi:dihydrofolate reductase